MNMAIKLVGFDTLQQTIDIFSHASKDIKADAESFIYGKRTKKAARAFLGLSKNKKMPCYTISLSERASCPRGDKLAKIAGTICSNCYAAHGADAWAPAINAKARRYALMQLATQNDYTRRLVVEAYCVALASESHFRFHSSGDIFSADYAALMGEVISQNPNTEFWIPTREARYAELFQQFDNVAFRVSDDLVNQQTNKHKGLTSGAHDNADAARGFICPAMNNGGACNNCRACWSHDVAHVSYKLH